MLGLLILISMACSKSDDNPPTPESKLITNVKLKVSFTDPVSSQKSDLELTKETPMAYKVALKSATLIGSGTTANHQLFNETNLASSQTFDFTDNNVLQSLFSGNSIPEGSYSKIKLEVYYLQMKIRIATINRGEEHRNIRVYLSDDIENESGTHHAGDMVQYSDAGLEHGWLLGENQMPDMDPVSPRNAAYQHGSGGWYDFNGKSGQHYGPFGDEDFMNNAPFPIYNVQPTFSFSTLNGGTIIIDLNIGGCWQFQDKSGDTMFGAADLDPNDPTSWEMVLPDVQVTIE